MSNNESPPAAGGAQSRPTPSAATSTEHNSQPHPDRSSGYVEVPRAEHDMLPSEAEVAEALAYDPEFRARVTELRLAQDAVTIPRAEYAQLMVFATSWLRFWAGDYLDDLVDQRMKAISRDLSGAMRWSEIGPRHTELARLRATPAWVNTCARTGCRWSETVYDRAHWTYLCPRHREAAGVAA